MLVSLRQELVYFLFVFSCDAKVEGKSVENVNGVFHTWCYRDVAIHLEESVERVCWLLFINSRV